MHGFYLCSLPGITQSSFFNYEYLTSANHALLTCVGKCEEVIKYSAPIFSSFSVFLLNLCNNSDQT